MFISSLAIACVSTGLLVLPADAKPGKGNKGRGGPPGQSQGGGPPGHAKAKKGKAKTSPGKRKARPGPAQGGPKVKRDKGKPAKQGRGGVARYEERDRTRILDYFERHRERPRGLPPGLAKRVADGKGLPPGWRKKVEPGWRVNDEWWNRFEPVPYRWFPDLPIVDDTGLYLLGDRILRVHEPRREVIDVIVIPTIRL